MTVADEAAVAAALARRLAALPESAMREAALLEYLKRTPADDAVAVLDYVRCRGAQGGPPFSVALLALVRLLNSERVSYDLTTELYLASKSDGLDGIGYLLLTGTTNAGDSGAARARGGQELTLGHRKTVARTGARDAFNRLLRNPEVAVVEQLLLNPRLTERDVVGLASRRPVDPEIQHAIVASDRWGKRYPIKRAVVLNPYTPTALGIRLLGFLMHADLELVASTSNLPDPIREAATQLIQQRRSPDGSPLR